MNIKKKIILIFIVPISLLLICILALFAWPTIDAIGEFTKPKSQILLNTGKVKWFNMDKGFGFIEPDGNGADIFFNAEAFTKYGIKTLNEGDKVKFQLIVPEPKNGARASDIEIIL